MRGIWEIAGAILAQSQRRLESAAANVANIATPGYKRRVAFSDVLAQDSGAARAGRPADSTFLDVSAGKLMETGKPTDLALAGDGFFILKSDDKQVYSRLGQFRRDGDGRLVSGDGFALQAKEGGDVVLRDGAFELKPDGTIVQNGAPVARVAVAVFAEPSALASRGGYFEAGDAEPQEVAAPALRQGALEASNVSTGDEMVTMMESVRRAESAQRILNTYDDLMGRAIGAFGQF
jgi:flagellar basal-body rod protein FlgG